MAEGFLRHYLEIAGLGSAARAVRSAGLEAHGVNPLAVKVMALATTPISGQKSETMDQYLSQPFDYIITVCDNAASRCPVFPGNGERIHWPFDDPAEATGTKTEILAEFSRVRDQIRDRVKAWLGV
jgi:arsenate reductase